MGQPSPEAVQNLTRDLLSRSTSRPDASAAAGDAGYAWLLSSRRGSRAALRSQPPPFGRSPGAWRCLRLHSLPFLTVCRLLLSQTQERMESQVMPECGLAQPFKASGVCRPHCAAYSGASCGSSTVALERGQERSGDPA